MSGFVKIYGTILDSSIWGESPATVKVWITMLAMADAKGIVRASMPGLTRRAVVARQECEEAIEKFLSPDADSTDKTRNPNSDGRRIEAVEGGWRIINHTYYRDLRTDKQVSDAERIREKRERGEYDSRGPGRDATSATRSDVALEEEEETEKEKSKRSSSSPSPTSEDATRSILVSSGYEPDLVELLTRVAATPNASTAAWHAEIGVAQDGMHGAARTPEQIGQAIRDFNASGAEINLRLFRGYLRGTVSPPKSSSSKSNGKKPWEVAAEREARDERLNKSQEVQDIVARFRKTDPNWWKRMCEEAKEQNRWAAPYAYDNLTGGITP